MPQDATDAEPDFLTVAAVAMTLQVSTRTVWRWIAEHRLPVYRLGRNVRVARADLDAFLRSHLDA